MIHGHINPYGSFQTSGVTIRELVESAAVTQCILVSQSFTSSRQSILGADGRQKRERTPR